MLSQENQCKTFSNRAIKIVSINLLLLLSINFVQAQSLAPSSSEEVSHDISNISVEKEYNSIADARKTVLPVFDVSQKYSSIHQFIQENLEFPEVGVLTGKSGLMVLQFQILANGDISDIQFIQSPGSAFSSAVSEVLVDLPKWKPAYKNNTPTQTTYQLKIDFALR